MAGPLSPKAQMVRGWLDSANHIGGAVLDPQFYKDAFMNAAPAAAGVLSQTIGLPGDLLDAIPSSRKRDPKNPMPLSSDWLLKGWGLGDNQSAQITNAVPMPGPGDVKPMLGILAGARAAGADLKKLEVAKSLEGVASPEQVWKDTGWFKAPDGKWKWEIDDSKSALTHDPEVMGEKGGGGPIDRLLYHPELYKNYPELRGITGGLDFEGKGTSRGGYIKHSGEGINDPGAIYAQTAGPNGFLDMPQESARGVLLHELNHAVQQIEGFGGGGSPKGFESSVQKYRSALDELDAHDAIAELQKTKPGHTPTNDEINHFWVNNYGSKNIPEFAIENARLGRALSNPEAARAMAQNDVDRYYKIFQELPGPGTAMKAYKRLLGEIESRVTQDRMNWSPERRAAFPPWKHSDYQLNPLIRDADGGVVPALSPTIKPRKSVLQP